jgi:tricorn protease
MTHKPGATDLCGWTPDGQLLFMTNASFAPAEFGDQAYLRQLFVVAANGGLPKQLPLEHAANGAISADGQWLAFTPYTEGRTEHRLHYHGGFAPEIWLYNLVTHRERRITSWTGTNTDPMWHGEAIYYLSDEGDGGRRNIWSYSAREGSRRQITHFTDFDVKWPSMGPGANGEGEIVFVKETRLYLLDLKTGTTHAVTITIPEDRRSVDPHPVDASNTIAGWSPSPDGAKVVVEARGALWIVSKGATSPPLRLSHEPGSAQRYPSWSPDGQSIAYFSDESGEYQLYSTPSDGSGNPRQLSRLGAGFRFSPVWSPNSQYIAFTDGVGGLYLCSLATGETKKIHADQLVRRVQFGWSPDSSWLAFTGETNGSQAIWLFDLHSGGAHLVTGGGYNDNSPTFSPDGRYLFFITNRNYQETLIEDSIDYSNFAYPSAQLLMCIPLRSGLSAPGLADGPTGATAPDQQKSMTVDLDDMERRAVMIVADVGTYSSLAFSRDGKLLYTFTPEDRLFPKSSGPGQSLKMIDFESRSKAGDRSAKTVIDGVNQWEVRFPSDGNNILIRQGSAIASVAAVPDQKLNQVITFANLTMQIDPRMEWKQIFSDAWRLYRDFFYDPSMRGMDWTTMRAKYEPLVEACADREDLDYVIGEMLGELGSSHVYLSPPPGNQLPPEKVGLLGVDFALDSGAYRIARIYDSAASDFAVRSPLRRAGIDIQEGDYLLAVDGAPVDTQRDPWAAFVGLAGKSVTLTVSSKPVIDSSARHETVQPEFYEEERHKAWVEANRAYVDKKSSGRIGYVYLKMTSEYGMREFTRQFGTELNKGALIIDIRWNQGGHIPYHILDLLRREVAFYSSDMRRPMPQAGPAYANNGPKCLMINGVTQSGGDLLAYMVKQTGTATLLGTRTNGAMAGSGGSSIPFVDGGNSFVPTVGFYDAHGRWSTEGFGVSPDIEVPDDPAARFGNGDPQLDAAIRVLLDKMREHSGQQPKAPF